jgi:hypothetical protein
LAHPVQPSHALALQIQIHAFAHVRNAPVLFNKDGLFILIENRKKLKIRKIMILAVRPSTTFASVF